MRIQSSSRVVLISVAVAGIWLLAGCGNFWRAPGATGSGGTTPTTTTLTASTSTPAVGAAVTLTATVSPSAATGTVTFNNGSSSIGTGTLASGTATLSTSFTTAGSASITATYGGSSTYAASTSSAVAITVSAAPASPANKISSASTAATSSGAAASGGNTTSDYQAAAIRTAGAVNLTGGAYTAKDAEAVVVEDSGSVILNGTTLSGSAGDDRGILLYSTSAGPSSSTTRFAMTGGSIAYNCNAASTPVCAEGSTSGGQNNPATVFSIANTTASIALTDVSVTNNTSTSTNNEGTLLTAEESGTEGANGGNVTFTVRGTALTGSVIVDRTSTAELSLLEDSAGTGSSLSGAINTANTGKTVSVTLDQGSVWTVTGASYVTALSGLDLSGNTVNNIDGGGHCVYYSGAVNGSNSAVVYQLSGGGYLAPVGDTGLNCD